MLARRVVQARVELLGGRHVEVADRRDDPVLTRRRLDGSAVVACPTSSPFAHPCKHARAAKVGEFRDYDSRGWAGTSTATSRAAASRARPLTHIAWWSPLT